MINFLSEILGEEYLKLRGNWPVKNSPLKIKFEYMKGIKDTLADTVCRLINIDPNIQLDPEPEGLEFGYYGFDSLI